MESVLDNHLQIFLISSAMSCFSMIFAVRRGFFKLDEADWQGSVSARDLFGSFLCFLGVHLVIAPGSAIYAGKFFGYQIEDTHAQGWMVIYSMFFACLALFFYTLRLTDENTRLGLWPGNQTHKLRAFYFGALSLLIGYPLVIAVGQLIRMLQISVFQIPEVDQVAVQALKLSLDYPYMSILMIVGVIFIVPIAEELLFRGYLQGWMRRFVQPKTAIILTSIIFAGFHYSLRQGWSNVELLVSLFILSCILGLLYEKQRTLWAPIGLHMAFNSINVGLLIHSTAS